MKMKRGMILFMSAILLALTTAAFAVPKTVEPGVTVETVWTPASLTLPGEATATTTIVNSNQDGSKEFASPRVWKKLVPETILANWIPMTLTGIVSGAKNGRAMTVAVPADATLLTLKINGVAQTLPAAGASFDLPLNLPANSTTIVAEGYRFPE